MVYWLYNIALFIFHKRWNPLLQSFGALNDTRLQRARSTGARWARFTSYTWIEITFISRVKQPQENPFIEVIYLHFSKLLWGPTLLHNFTHLGPPGCHPTQPTNPSYFLGGKLKSSSSKIWCPSKFAQQKLGPEFWRNPSSSTEATNQTPADKPETGRTASATALARKRGGTSPSRKRQVTRPPRLGESFSVMLLMFCGANQTYPWCNIYI